MKLVDCSSLHTAFDFNISALHRNLSHPIPVPGSKWWWIRWISISQFFLLAFTPCKARFFYIYFLTWYDLKYKFLLILRVDNISILINYWCELELNLCYYVMKMRFKVVNKYRPSTFGSPFVLSLLLLLYRIYNLSLLICVNSFIQLVMLIHSLSFLCSCTLCLYPIMLIEICPWKSLLCGAKKQGLAKAVVIAWYYMVDNY